MNKRQVVVLWIIAIVLALAAFISRSGNSNDFESKTDRERGQTVLADFPAKNVAKIQINSGDDQATLVRKDGSWTVENRDQYPANITAVNEFLRTLSEVEVTQGIEAEPSVAPRFGLDPDSSDETDRGIDVVMSDDAGKQLAHVTFGKNLESGDNRMSMMSGGATGRFIQNHEDESGFYVVSEIFPTLTAQPKGWLKDDFLKVEKIKSISVSPRGMPTKIDWMVSRDDDTAELTLADPKDGETLDSGSATALKGLFAYTRFEDILPDDMYDDYASLLEMRTVKIDTFEGFHYTFKICPIVRDKQEPTPEGQDPQPDFLMTVDVAAEIPAERKKEADETEDDAKTKDEAFAKRKGELEQRLAADKKFAGIVFKVGAYTVQSFMKDRADILQKPAAAGQSANGMPGAMPNRPRRPVQAVTPPIAIPGR